MCAVLHDFQCRRCGDCCRWSGHVYLTADDISSMAEALEMDEEGFIDKYTQLGPNRKKLCLDMRSDEACIFLDGNHCAVYAVRPMQCREFPKSWKVPHGCPGVREDPEVSL